MKWRTTLTALIVLVVLANGLALWSAARNRVRPQREMTLSRNELSVRTESRNRSTVQLSILIANCLSSSDWLDDAKMQSLGFRPIRSERDIHQLPRMVWAVLELDGPARERCGLQESVRTSGLIAVDAAREPAILKTRYPDASRYWIVRAEVMPSYFESQGSPAVRRGLLVLRVPEVTVPRQYAWVFRDWNSSRGDVEATIRIGSRYEPYLVAARRIGTIAPKE